LQRDSIALAASTAHEKGREIGHAEGREEGIGIDIDKTKLEVSQRLMARGMSADEAAEITGIDVNQLRNQQAAV